jgi:hypothetical protein
MIGTRSLAVLAAWLVVASAASAQTAPAKFRWQQGQVLNYAAEQITTETDVVGGTKVESWMKLTTMKRWQVLAVDPAGVATVQQSLTAMRLEKKVPSGATAVFDSTHPEQSDPGMREQLGKFVGTPLAILRIDNQGKVVEVKESKHTPASRYETELPFAITLPPNALRVGESWERSYQVTLEPPLGANDKYPAVQKYTCKEIANGIATITLSTTVQAPPEEEAPLVQFQPAGEVVFDLQLGCPRKVQIVIDKELKNQQGENSSYRFQSRYTEEYLGNK